MNPTDPLAQLKDIHTPDPISWWPLAWGWWVVIALCLALLTLIIVWAIKRKRRARYRKQALAELHRLAKNELNAGEFIAAINHLLKRVVQHQSSHTQASASTLSGHAWLTYLDQSQAKNSTAFREGAGRALGEAAYRPNPSVDRQAVVALANRWIKQYNHSHCVKAQERTHV